LHPRVAGARSLARDRHTHTSRGAPPACQLRGQRLPLAAVQGGVARPCSADHHACVGGGAGVGDESQRRPVAPRRRRRLPGRGGGVGGGGGCGPPRANIGRSRASPGGSGCSWAFWRAPSGGGGPAPPCPSARVVRGGSGRTPPVQLGAAYVLASLCPG